MTNLHTAYAQAIALHQELEAQFTEPMEAEQKRVLDQADDLVRTIGQLLAAD